MKIGGLVAVAGILLTTSPRSIAALRNKQKRQRQQTPQKNNHGFDEQMDEDEMVEVIIGLNMDDEEEGEPTFTAMSNTIDLLDKSVSLEDLIPQIRSGVVRVPFGMLDTIQQDPKVRFIERNGDIYENSEVTPVSIRKAFGAARAPPDLTPSPGLSFDCTDPDSFRVAVVDGGIDVGHYDFEYCGVFDQNGQPNPNREQHCMGKAFLRSSDAAEGQDWYNSNREHGCHVAGTVAASGLNDAGVLGMISDEKICLVIARVFGDGGGATVAKVAEAIVWAADSGAKVINMSLGTANAYTAVTNAIDYAYSKGSILVASSGNGADDSPPTLVNYPADYPNVLSVAAVDASYNHASFSNWNWNVNLAAVGVDVISTYPLPTGGTTFEIVSDAGTFSGIHMIYSKYTSSDGVTGVLVDCGRGTGPCPGDGGHVCLIERGGPQYHTKVLMCEQSNGVAAIIYSDDDSDVLGSMGQVNNSPKFTSIPAVGIDRDSGLKLLDIKGTEVVVTSRLIDGYGTMSGTSMAAPHVSGAAGLLWRSCSDCAREDVVNCLLSTAEDVGPTGKDQYTGSGVLNTDKALLCLRSQSCCAPPETEQLSTDAPSPAPSPMPTSSPTSVPTEIPTMIPTDGPTSMPTEGPTTSPTAIPAVTPSLSTASLTSNRCNSYCEDKELFCAYKANRTCSQEKGSCIASCKSAVDDGKLDRGLQGICETVWCVTDMERCVAEHESVCDVDYAACTQRC